MGKNKPLNICAVILADQSCLFQQKGTFGLNYSLPDLLDACRTSGCFLREVGLFSMISNYACFVYSTRTPGGDDHISDPKVQRGLLSSVLLTIRASLDPRFRYKVAEDDILFYLWWCVAQPKTEEGVKEGYDAAILYSLIPVSLPHSSISHLSLSLSFTHTLQTPLDPLVTLSFLPESSNPFPLFPTPHDRSPFPHRYLSNIRYDATRTSQGSRRRGWYSKLQDCLYWNRQGGFERKVREGGSSELSLLFSSSLSPLPL